jgi:uncharacterized protein (DUF697 family)
MLKYLKHARAAFAMLNPEEIRKRAGRRLHVGLVASSGPAYTEMEEFLAPATLPRGVRDELRLRIHRASEPLAPPNVDLVFYEEGLTPPPGAFRFHRLDPAATLAAVIRENEELTLPLAAQFPAFRKPVLDQIIHAVARENALFAIATAFPNVIPNLIELPWMFGEFASDTAFLTANQVRMAFLIAAACGKEVGFSRQRVEIGSIVAGAFGWRAIARELAGKIPLGGGLIPKGAIAYAGTVAVGKGLEYYYQVPGPFPREQEENVYREHLERGRAIAESLGAEHE